MASTSNPTGEISKGAQWIIDRIDSMQNDYREALMAAVTILQYQNNCKSLRLGRRDVPRYMTRRLDNAWSRYESTRRHVECYMRQNAQGVSTPSHPITYIPPSPAPVIPDAALLAPTPQEQPKASPIPLSTASLLAYDNTQSTAPQSAVPDTTVPVQPIQNLDMSFNNNGMMDLNSGNGGDNLDFSSMGINELTNLINSTNDFFPQSSNAGPGDTLNNNFNMFNAGGTGESKGQSEAETLFATLGAMGGNTQAGPSQNGDMDALLASLRGPQNSVQEQQTQSAPQVAGDTGQQDFNFDFGGVGADGDVDFSELVGLISDTNEGQQNGAGQQNSGTANAGGQEGQSQQNQAATQPTQSSAQVQSQQPQPQRPQPQQQDGQSFGDPIQTQHPSQPIKQPSQASQPSQPSQTDFTMGNNSMSNNNIANSNVASNNMGNNSMVNSNMSNSAIGNNGMANNDMGNFQLAMGSLGGNPNLENPQGNNEYDTGGIDLDDFNFGNSGIPNVEGDEFESLFAEFK